MTKWILPLEDWAMKVHANARQKGFWDDSQDIRDDAGAVDPTAFLAKVALMHSEVWEAYVDWKAGRTHMFLRDDGKPDGLPIEMADIAIRILDTMGGVGINVVVMETRGIYTSGAELLFNRLHGELAEATEQVRVQGSHWTYHAGRHFVTAIDICRELCERLCDERLEAMMEMKHEYNRTRPYRHGKKA